jgi:membrane fusion protein, multidrug efflux system
MSAILSERPETGAGQVNIKHPAEPKPDKADRSVPATRRPSSRGRQWLAIVAVLGLASGAWYVHGQMAASSKGETRSGDAANENGQAQGRSRLGFLTGGAKDAKNGSASAIQTMPVEVVNRSDILRLTGTLIADERSSVASNVSGIAAEVRVDRGSIVKKNDVMVQIDPTDAKNKLAEGQALLEELKARLGLEGNLANFNPEDEPEIRLAKASADLAASNLRRAKDLYSRKVMSAEAYDQTQTEFELASQRYRQALLQIKQVYQMYRTAQIKLGILEKAVADTTIRAPFDGLVAEKLVAVGEQISAGMQATKVVTLVRIDPLRLSLTVPQQNIGCIEVGQTVRFHVDSFPDRTFSATVRFIAPVVANDTRSMVVEAVVPNADRALRPGLFATAELVLPKKGAEVFVPTSAVQKLGEVARVFVVRDGAAREQVVALGDADKDKVQIKAGLSGKEMIVARPELVHDGDAVR